MASLIQMSEEEIEQLRKRGAWVVSRCMLCQKNIPSRDTPHDCTPNEKGMQMLAEFESENKITIQVNKPVTELSRLGSECPRCGQRRSAIDEHLIGPHQCAHLSEQQISEMRAAREKPLMEIFLPKRNGTE